MQLDNFVNPEDSYSDYLYQSNITPGLTASFNDYAKSLLSFTEAPQPTILDVGSNDGSFLNSCATEGYLPFGIEPNKYLASSANSHGLNTLQAFFDSETPAKLEQNEFPTSYDFITFNNVFANLSDPKSALVLAKSLLKSDKSSIVIQTGYHPEQFRNQLFDYVYHEHYSYFSVASISALAKSVSLHVVNYEFLPIRGGTLRIILSPSPSPSPSGVFHKDIIEDFLSVDSLKTFFQKCNASGLALRLKLQQLKNKNVPIVGFGSSHSTGVMVHTFNISSLLDYIIDENTLKHGRYMPGTSLEVKPLSFLSQDTVVVILAHQYFNAIQSKLRDISLGEIIHL